jgi:hypothetical protein
MVRDEQAARYQVIRWARSAYIRTEDQRWCATAAGCMQMQRWRRRVSWRRGKTPEGRGGGFLLNGVSCVCVGIPSRLACMHGINESVKSDVRGLAPVIAIK